MVPDCYGPEYDEPTALTAPISASMSSATNSALITRGCLATVPTQVRDDITDYPILRLLNLTVILVFYYLCGFAPTLRYGEIECVSKISAADAGWLGRLPV